MPASLFRFTGVHGNRTLKRGLQRHLMRLGGIDETDL